MHHIVWQLRRALDAAEPGASRLVVSRPAGYLLQAGDVEVDARQFRLALALANEIGEPRRRAGALSEALNLYRGPALADFAEADFARSMSVRLEEQRLAAWEDWAEAMLAAGEYTLLASELGALLEQYPFRERLRAAHMRALYAAGRRSEALASFDQIRTRLADELGLDAGADLANLRQEILEQAAPLRPTVSAQTTRPPGTNLPTPLTELVGREEAVQAVRALLARRRLVTLTGIGGVGKTRLALAVAAAGPWPEQGRPHTGWPDGVWLVELGALERHSRTALADSQCQVVELIAQTLGIRDEFAVRVPPGRQPALLTERLADTLRHKHLLLVLDNCEHLADRVAQVVEMLLNAAPGVRILATSREPLGIAGEQLRTVPPLDLPEPGTARNLDAVRECGAVKLFLACASASAPDFVVDERNVSDVETICRRLDGLPLALELAATRVRALGVHGVAARLDDRFELLTVGIRGAPDRQQTLRATIDWSWQLLSATEQAVLRRLSVAVRFTLPAAEKVCADEVIPASKVVTVVANLVDRCLVTVVESGPERRYRLPESIASYGRERLQEAGESDLIVGRYLRYHCELAERAAPQLRGAGQHRWLECLDAEAPDLRAALGVAADRGSAETAQRLVVALGWYWYLRGRHTEAGRACADALAASGPAPAGLTALVRIWGRVFALPAADVDPPLPESLLGPIGHPPVRVFGRWLLAFAQLGRGDGSPTERELRLALAEFERLGDDWGRAAALATLAKQLLLRGDLPAVERYGEQSAHLFRQLGDGWGQLQATDVLASVAEVKGEYELARQLHKDGLAYAEGLKLWTEVSLKLSGLGRLAMLAADYTEARELHERARRLADEQGFTFGTMFADLGLGMLARRLGELDRAESHLRQWLEWCRASDSAAGLALIYAELGFVAELRADLDDALAAHRAGFVAATETGDPRALALALEGFASVCAAAGRLEQAALLLGSASAARADAGAPLPIGEQVDVSRVTARISTSIPPATLRALLTRGAALSPAEAVAQVFSQH